MIALRSLAILALTTATLTPAHAATRLTMREAISRAREELQVYRGRPLERLSDRLAVGKSDFNPKQSVSDNLLRLAREKQIPHYYADLNGRSVLHVVVDLASPKTRELVRATMRRVGRETVELNYKASSDKSPYGHVAVRIGGGATYDLTGKATNELPPILRALVKAVRGDSLAFGRKRNLRRFWETRRAGPKLSPSLFYGMLFHATPQDQVATTRIFDQRLKTMKDFSVSGGDASKGVFSCAQFLTHAIPFLNTRGVGATVGAQDAASSAAASPALEAVLVYRTPGVTEEAMRTSLP